MPVARPIDKQTQNLNRSREMRVHSHFNEISMEISVLEGKNLFTF